MTALINPASLERLSNKPELQRHLVQLYLDTSGELLASISSSLERGDLDQLGFHAHSLKGASLEVGADRLAELGQQLQQESKAGTREAIEALVSALARCHEQTASALAALEFG